MPAIAHQNKILGNTSGGGSTILVTTSESTLYGQTVTLSDGTTTMSGTFSNAGECEFTGVMMVGTLTASSGGASTSIQVPYFGVYSMSLAFFSATITVTYSGGTCTCVGNGESYTASSSPYTFTVHGAATYTITVTIDGISKTDTVTITTDGQSESVSIEFGTINVTYDNDFRGTSITCTQGGTTITKTAPSGANTMTFYPPTTGNWVISGTVSGTPYSKTANVTSLSTSVSVSLETVPDGKTTTPTDDIEKWLQCGQITGKSYTTLSQVLADAETYERLLSDSNACDYMARSTTWASTICADADAMMRLGKYDYACDALLADSTWASAIATSTYVSYVLDNTTQVPTMTSNTTPSGEVSTNYKYANREPYQAFDGQVANFNTGAHYWYSTNINQYLEYEFTQDVCVTSVSFYYVNSLGSNAVLKIQASDDNETWTDLITDGITLAPRSTSQGLQLVTANIDTAKIGKYCRAYVYSIVSGGGGTNGIGLNRVQFNGYYRHTAQTDIIVTAHGGDTVYYMENGSPVTLTTADSDTGIGTVDWSDLPKGAITLYSSTAKNPSDLTADYSKTVYVTEYTTQIYLMPENTLYWYGYENNLEDVTTANGWSNSISHSFSGTVTHNTSSIRLQAPTTGDCGVGNKNAITFTKAYAIVTVGNGAPGFTGLSSKTTGWEANVPSSGTSLITYQNQSGNVYVWSMAINASRYGDIHAIFYETA